MVILVYAYIWKSILNHKSTSETTNPPPQFESLYGQLHTYRVIPANLKTPVQLDLGFGIRYTIEAHNLNEDDSVRMVISEL